MSQSLSLEVLPVLVGDQEIVAALVLSALTSLVLLWLLQQWKSLLPALLGNAQSLPRAVLLAELISLCSKLSKQSCWRNKTNQGRRCCQPGRDLRDSRSRLDAKGKFLCAAVPPGVKLRSWPWFFQT